VKKTSILNKLRSSGLRPTIQRVEIAKFLFNRDKTFHFTVESLGKHLAKKKLQQNLHLQQYIILFTLLKKQVT